MPLFSKLPAEIQIIIFHEALRKPQIHFIKATREQNPGERNPSWTVALKARDKSSDTSGYRLLKNMEDIARSFPVAAEVMRKNILEPHRLPLMPVPKEGSWSIDAATDLVVIEFDRDKSGKMRFWHPRNRVYTSTQDVDAIRHQLEGIRKVAFVYGGDQQPDAGSSESVFPCLNHHQRKHASWQFCPEELLGFIYQLSHVEAVYFILKARINTKVVKEYATSYFSSKLPCSFVTHFSFGPDSLVLLLNLIDMTSQLTECRYSPRRYSQQLRLRNFLLHHQELRNRPPSFPHHWTGIPRDLENERLRLAGETPSSTH